MLLCEFLVLFLVAIFCFGNVWVLFFFVEWNELCTIGGSEQRLGGNGEIG